MCVYRSARSGSSGESIRWCRAVAGYGAVGRIVGLDVVHVNHIFLAVTHRITSDNVFYVNQLLAFEDRT
jgi:multisubunit Na+/H+ antiporter MnhF subunit